MDYDIPGEVGEVYVLLLARYRYDYALILRLVDKDSNIFKRIGLAVIGFLIENDQLMDRAYDRNATETELVFI